MLKKSKISQIPIHSDEWKTSRLGKFTSSEIFKLMSSQYESYVRLKVGEVMTGLMSASWMTSKGEINTDATMWGLLHEVDALKKFGTKMELPFMVTQKLITEEGSRFGCTPDGLIVKRISPDETEYEVETVEVKCPPTYDNYLLLWECETPKDLKEVNKQYYWQVLDQMDNCESLTGHFVAYHPDFKSGNMRHIVFNSMQPEEKNGSKTFPLFTDLKALRKQKAQAVIDFEFKKEKLLLAGKI
jgi:hypothetical protein